MGLMKTKHTVALSLFYLVSWLVIKVKETVDSKQAAGAKQGFPEQQYCSLTARGLMPFLPSMK